MKIKFRELINPYILNDEWVGFCGDSEYVNEDGQLKMGYWEFLSIIETKDAPVGNKFTLDDEIDDSELQHNLEWEVENDKGTVCMVRIIYKEYEEIKFNADCNDTREVILDVESTISNIHMRNICLDDYKSRYMHITQGLKAIIHCDLCSECDNSIESMEEIRELSKMLISEKDEVIDRFQAVLNLIEQLDCELRDLIEDKNS